MTSFERGDVLLVRFPDSNLTTFKLRPALVVQNPAVETGLDQRIVAMITSNTRRGGLSRVFVAQASAEGRAMGLLSDSVVVADNLATVASFAVARVLGKCPIMEQVDRALRAILGLEGQAAGRL